MPQDDSSPTKIPLSVQESIEYATNIARLDGIAEGVRLMVEHIKSEALQQLLATRKKPAEPPKETTDGTPQQ